MRFTLRSSFFILSILLSISTHAQVLKDSSAVEVEVLDSLYISETEEVAGPEKVFHAEPLFIDLIRDLGARKGEREINVGFGMTDCLVADKYQALVEYEWAPVNRLGLEVELPFVFYTRRNDQTTPREPRYENKNALNGLKLAAQYTFYASERRQTSLAVGYIHELLNGMGQVRTTGRPLRGNSFNPFVVGARRWGQNLHTLVYTGPVLEKEAHHPLHVTYQWNSNLHYMLPGTRNFIGMEVNKSFDRNNFDMVFRPQMRLSLTDRALVGLVSGIPVSRRNERMSFFLRLIYEPRHSHS